MAEAAAAAAWTPPKKIEDLFSKTSGNQFAAINAPTAGARTVAPLPVGKAKFQFYSLKTPNGQKPAILLEELGLDYDAHTINIMKGEQFTSGFVEVCPNSKIPCAVDTDTKDGKPVRLFESVSIMLYLAEKHQRFIPKDPSLRAEMMNWLFWQVGGQGPITGACFGHFFVYAPADKLETRDYGVARYGMDVQRLCDVLDKHLEGKTYMVGEEYTIADMAIFTWFQQLRTGYIHSSGVSANDFLSISQYKNVCKWADSLVSREAVKRGMSVCGWDAALPSKPWLAQKL